MPNEENIFDDKAKIIVPKVFFEFMVNSLEIFKLPPFQTALLLKYEPVFQDMRRILI